MLYITYKNINEEGFVKTKDNLNEIEKIISPIMKEFNFSLNLRDYDEVLNLDYVFGYNGNYGNIGVTYDEEQSILAKSLFRFYILKAHDKDGFRYFKKGGLNKLLSLEELCTEAPKLFEECLSLYNSITNEDLTESVRLK